MYMSLHVHESSEVSSSIIYPKPRGRHPSAYSGTPIIILMQRAEPLRRLALKTRTYSCIMAKKRSGLKLSVKKTCYSSIDINQQPDKLEYTIEYLSTLQGITDIEHSPV